MKTKTIAVYTIFLGLLLLGQQGLTTGEGEKTVQKKKKNGMGCSKSTTSLKELGKRRGGISIDPDSKEYEQIKNTQSSDNLKSEK